MMRALPTWLGLGLGLGAAHLVRVWRCPPGRGIRGACGAAVAGGGGGGALLARAPLRALGRAGEGEA
jgi:hypothetical protein